VIFGFLKTPSCRRASTGCKTPRLFRTLKPLEVKFVDGLMHERRYLPEEIIFDENEEGQALYLVMAGRVEHHPRARRQPQLVSELGRAASSATWRCSTTRRAAPRRARSTGANWRCSSATTSWR
jgi:hypothetical protein